MTVIQQHKIAAATATTTTAATATAATTTTKMESGRKMKRLREKALNAQNDLLRL